jgi:hypothetical protein
LKDIKEEYKMTKDSATSSRHGIGCEHLVISALAISFMLATILFLRYTPVNAGSPPPTDPAAVLTTTTPFTATGNLPLSTTLQPMQTSELSDSRRGVQVLFPPDAVNSPRLITLTLGTVGLLPRRLDLIGPAFQLETNRSDERETKQPFTITLRYTPTHTIGNVLIIEWSSQGKWLPLPTQVNTTTQTATALGTHFTAYAVAL